ncbi:MULTISPECIES: hypothetical protein [Pseudomonas]|uniref:hypothetical protein n=1 Tax=Pseudomonas nitroreducens TaxID=46680 RepID=UPI001E49056D|nr:MULTISPECIES: hypothetical protein [Pseudomonas]MCE4073556.1 hypothetical protein [Pseudomonas nitritireducens]MCE4079795.1 hypothetical protein [Pseudomonas nitroreducens]
MQTFPWKASALVLVAVLLVAIGAAGGAWLSSEQYAPQLKDTGAKLATCVAARDNVLALVTEQGAKLGELANQAEQRQAKAAQSVADAQQQAGKHYAAAQRLQQERAEGDSAKVAESLIDKELGL